MSAAVINFPRHKRMVYESLGGCSRCVSWEGETPTDCPGERMTPEQLAAVASGRLDFIRGEGWTEVTIFHRHRVRMYCEEGRDL